jgi:hypothetical protein
MAADTADPVHIWLVATRLMDGDGVPQDEEAARDYLSRLEVSTNVERLSRLALLLRCGSEVRMDVSESLRWYRRCCELGDVCSFEHLGRCYEKGIGVEVDLVEAARLYQRASELGSRTSQLSLGVFHWRGIGGFSVDRAQAVRLWRLGGLEIPDSSAASSIPRDDSSARSSRFFSSEVETDETGINRRESESLSVNRESEIPVTTAEIDSRTASAELSIADRESRSSESESRSTFEPSEAAAPSDLRGHDLPPDSVELEGRNLAAPFTSTADRVSVDCASRPFDPVRIPESGSGPHSEERPLSSPPREHLSVEGVIDDPPREMVSRPEMPDSPDMARPSDSFEAVTEAICGEADELSPDLSPADYVGDVVPRAPCESFALSTSDHFIDSIVLADNRSVRDFLGESPPAAEIVRLSGEGIRREGSRCVADAFDKDQGRLLCEEMLKCDTMESVLRLCAVFYTRNTFLYRRVNQFLRSSREADVDTGRNLGLYIGLLRECFCVSGGSSPLLWESPTVVYRGADFTIDVVVDYARRPEELIRWQGFTSSSRDRKIALSFPGNVLFEISLAHPVASLDSVSAFKNEHEVILSPYQRFQLNCVRWDSECGRWILSVEEESNLPAVKSWLVKVDEDPAVE